MNRRYAAEHEGSSRHQELWKRAQFEAELQQIRLQEQSSRDQESPEYDLWMLRDSPGGQRVDPPTPSLQAAEDAEPDAAGPEELVPLSELWEVQDQDIDFASLPLEELPAESHEDEELPEGLREDEDMLCEDEASQVRASGGVGVEGQQSQAKRALSTCLFSVP